MTDMTPKFDPSSEKSTRSQAPPEQVSRTKLIIGILVMLIPAGVPLYFALITDGTTAILLFSLAGVIALMNTMLVYGIWSWVNSMNSPS